MAESSAAAFGRYLRVLRERRGLSLQQVCLLTASSPEPFDKGMLSRLERGQQIPSIFKLGPLSRIYEISPAALIERMELDREVDHLAPVETAGSSFDELHQLGGAALTQGNRKWEAYAYFRDAFPAASAERRVAAWINLITAIRSLGKNELALHELRELEASGRLVPAQQALVHERMSNCHRCLGDMRRAEERADAAAALALELGDRRMLAFAYQARANALVDQESWEAAADFLGKALAEYGQSAEQSCLLLPNPSFQAQSMLMLADCSIHLGNVARARRLALTAKRLAQEHDLPLGLAYADLLLGRLDDREGEANQAAERWRHAASLAARLDNRRLAFTVELEQLLQAHRAGDPARTRAARRRLERLAPSIPRHIPAYREFKDWLAQNPVRPASGREGDPDVRISKNAFSRSRVGTRDRPGAGADSGRARPRRDDRRLRVVADRE